MIDLFTVDIEYGVLGGSKNIPAEGKFGIYIFSILPDFCENVLRDLFRIKPVLQIPVGKVINPFDIQIIDFLESLTIAFNQPDD